MTNLEEELKTLKKAYDVLNNDCMACFDENKKLRDLLNLVLSVIKNNNGCLAGILSLGQEFVTKEITEDLKDGLTKGRNAVQEINNILNRN